MSDLNSVVISKKPDGSWQALHVPSERYAFGETAIEAQEQMRSLLGINESGDFEQAKESKHFEGTAQKIALFIEGEVSKMLELHSGFARLASYEDGVVEIELGGGCQGCPSSLFTLMNSVRSMLEAEFGQDVVREIVPVQ
jgi:Fe-S cluster biogenesis protein NfuA